MTWARDHQLISPPVVSFQARRAIRSLRPAEAYDRIVRHRVGLAWGLVFLNVLTFYAGTWNTLPLIVHIPSAVGKGLTQGALPAALLVAWSANRRMLIRPNVFLSLMTLLLLGALISNIQPVGHIIGTLYRTVRLGEFVAILWLLTPWGSRRDLLLVRCQLMSLFVVLGSVLLGLVVSPNRALAQGRLSGEFWPITPVQVADFAAVALGLVLVLWCCGEASGRLALATAAVVGSMLVLTHTRTEVVALMAGLLVAGLSMFSVKARIRKLFAAGGIMVSVAIIAFSSVLTTWLARGQDAQSLTELTGRTTIWTAVVNTPRDWFQVIFGFGLSDNASSSGLPIDGTWLAAYQDLGLVGVGLCAAFLLFVLVNAYFQPRSERRALALFLVTYLLVTSFTETGLSDASMYLLELALAALLLLPSAADRSLV